MFGEFNTYLLIEKYLSPLSQAELASPSETWQGKEFAPAPEDTIKPNHPRTTSHWGDANDASVTQRKAQPSGWEDTEFEPLEETFGVSCKLEDAKKKREERKLMRQKELEARRANRTTGGPMKLGAKKM